MWAVVSFSPPATGGKVQAALMDALLGMGLEVEMGHHQ
jgi:hypothetical protein